MTPLLPIFARYLNKMFCHMHATIKEVGEWELALITYWSLLYLPNNKTVSLGEPWQKWIRIYIKKKKNYYLLINLYPSSLPCKPFCQAAGIKSAWLLWCSLWLWGRYSPPSHAHTHKLLFFFFFFFFRAS